MAKTTSRLLRALSVLAMSTLGVAQAATIVIQSRDPAGVGFNDPTPVDPVGGNPGTTLGQQRFNVYRHAANLWEAALQSNVTITVSAGWEPLTCSATQAVLGSAGAWNVWTAEDAGGVPGMVPNTWYPQALANKILGADFPTVLEIPDDGTGFGNVDIKTQFNVNLGKADCLPGRFFYLGLDGNAGSNVNFLSTLLHELGHGLGFSVLTTSTANGSRFIGLPSIWEGFMFDNSVNKTWLAMTSAERAASAIRPLRLTWNGVNAVSGVPQVLGGTPSLLASTPAPGFSGFYDYNTASFGPPVVNPGGYGVLRAPSDLTGCNAYSAADAALVAGKVALVSRGVCGFVVKTKNAQNAGATAVVIANNVAGAAPGLGGADPTITIPTVSVSLADGDKLRLAIAAAVKYGSRTKPGSVSLALSTDNSRRAGADFAGRPLLYTPNPREPGSSVSHWDTSMSRNQLMEPFISSDLTTNLVPPFDLTVPLLKDIGW